MRALLLPIGIVLAQVFAASALAQSKGEADPAQSKAIAVQKATAEEKAAAKATRKAAGASVAKAKKTDDDPSPAGVARKTTKEERQAAAAKRKADLKEAARKGEIPSGEK